MTFEDGSLLVGLVALGIPLAVHLLGRRKACHVLLPTARFAQSSHQARRGRLWIKRAALLGLRLAAVALLVFALAGPRIGPATADARGQIWAICLDTSLSMATREGDVTRYEQARRTVLEVLAGLDEQTRVYLARCGEPVLRGSPETIRAAIPDEPADEWREEPIGSLLARTVSRLPHTKDGQEARLLVLTDATPWALRDLGDGQFQDLTADVFITAVGSEVQNGWLDLPKPLVHQAPDGLHLVLEVDATTSDRGSPASPGQSPATPGRRPARVHLRLADQSETFSTETAGGAGRARFLVPLTGSGPWQGRVWMDWPDALEEDNERFFTAAAPAVTRVLVVDASDREAGILASDYVTAAFAGTDPLAPKEAKCVAATALADEDLERADAILWIGSQAAGRAASLTRYVERGGLLIWIPADPQAPQPELARLLGIETDGAEETEAGITIEPAGYTSDLLAAFEGGTGGDLGRPVFCQRLILKPSQGSRSIRFTDGRPAIVSHRCEQGRTISLAVGPDKVWGDLASHAEFVVLLHSLVEAAGTTARQRNLVLGQAPGVDGLGPENYSERATSAIPAGEGPPAGKGPFSVNVTPEETANLFPRPNHLAAAFDPARVCILGNAQDLFTKGLTTPSSRDVAAWFVLPLAMVLIGETLLAGRGSASPAMRPKSPTTA